MENKQELIELIEWLKGEKYGYFLEDGKTWVNYGELNDKFPYDENEKKWELSRNRMIDKTISKINEMIVRCDMEFKVDQKIQISGEVKYGDNYYRVASGGVIVTPGKNRSLVTIDMVDGDSNVTIYVDNKYIFAE